MAIVTWLLPLLNLWDTSPTGPPMGAADNLCRSHTAASVCRWHCSFRAIPKKICGGPGLTVPTQHRGRNWDEVGRSTSCSISLHEWNPTEFQIIISNSDLKVVSEFCLLGRPIVWVSKKKKNRNKKRTARLLGEIVKMGPRDLSPVSRLSGDIHSCDVPKDGHQSRLLRLYLNTREVGARSNRLWNIHHLPVKKQPMKQPQDGKNSLRTGISTTLPAVCSTMLAFTTYQDLC